MTESTFDAEKQDSQTTESATELSLEQQVEFLELERSRLEAEKTDLLRLAQNRQAEFENYRRRMERERTEIADFAAAETLKALLPVFDDFERALQVETADTNYAKGVDLIYNRFKELLLKLGLEPIDTAGQTFDPNLHHGIDMVETDEAEDQAILAEFQKGYFLRGKLLRPSMVRIAVKK